MLKTFDIHILIPARYGSKGLPFKNRTLFTKTASIIPHSMASHVTVSTDDIEIKKAAEEYEFNVIQRPDDLANDTASTKAVAQHFVRCNNFNPNDLIAMLYLTYPERKWNDVSAALQFYVEENKLKADSLLCKQRVKSHPYLCMYDTGDNTGRQIIKHDLYRRQDYPECFELSHYICIFSVESLIRLNSNMYNETTVFYPIDNVVDVDTPDDLSKLKK